MVQPPSGLISTRPLATRFIYSFKEFIPFSTFNVAPHSLNQQHILFSTRYCGRFDVLFSNMIGTLSVLAMMGLAKSGMVEAQKAGTFEVAGSTEVSAMMVSTIDQVILQHPCLI